MSVNITVGNQVITIPSSGTDQNWAEGVVDALQAIATQLQIIAPANDVIPSVQVLPFNENTALLLNGAEFNSANVRSFVFNYAIYRVSDTVSITEEGTLNGIYNTDTATWEIQREFGPGNKQTNGTSYHSFEMSGDQVAFSSVAISGTYDGVNSTISFAGSTQLTTE